MGNTPRTTAATRANMHKAALRALDDPAKLARAARIVRAALERQRLTIQDLTPTDEPGDAA